MNDLVKQQLNSGNLFSVDLSFFLLEYIESFLEEKKTSNVESHILKNNFVKEFKSFSNIYSIDTNSYSSKTLTLNIKDNIDNKRIKLLVELKGRNVVFNIDYTEESYVESVKSLLPIFRKNITINLDNKYFSQSILDIKVMQNAYVNYFIKDDLAKKTLIKNIEVNEKNLSLVYLKDYLTDNQFLTEGFFEVLDLKYDNALENIRKYIDPSFLDKTNFNSYDILKNYLNNFNQTVKLEEKKKSDFYKNRK